MTSLPLNGCCGRDKRLKYVIPLPQGARETVKPAFTLAEVLITLGIIGIVAALTIPAVITNIRHKELQTGLKEAYSSISQALKLYHAENGVPLIASGVKHALKPAIMPYFRTAKDCGWGAGDASSSSAACIPSPNGMSDEQKESYKETYKNYNGTNSIRMDLFDDGQFIINNGMLILIEDPGSSNVFISVDVNGYDKKPNRLGQDLFMFQIDSSGNLLPMGAKGAGYSAGWCSKSSKSNENGAGCTVKALSDPKFFDNLP